MPNHVTSVVEFREAGILLKVGQNHVVRVLGALARVPRPTGPRLWMNPPTRGDDSTYEQYYSGALTGTQENPGEQPYYPRMPSLFVNYKGEAEFLVRDWS